MGNNRQTYTLLVQVYLLFRVKFLLSSEGFTPLSESIIIIMDWVKTKKILSVRSGKDKN